LVSSALWQQLGFAMTLSADKFDVFVVDDDLHVLESLRFLLETTGFNVRTFRSGEALLDQVSSKQADCFVIDYKMANMNGIDLTTCLHERNIVTPIILVTGCADENIASKAAAVGIRDVLIKPHLEDSLVARVLNVIQAAP
jgi:two-component system, LuxR family, response regulator FixJ